MPDPILTANLYAAGRLDALIAGAVVPLRRALDDVDPRCGLWMMRYRRGGEHLKLRLHGPAELRPRLRDHLARAAETGLAALGPATGERDAAAPTARARPAPPIDPEDADEHPDRSFVFTTWRRHPLSLGALLDDDARVDAILAALVAGCDRVLDAFAGGTETLTPGRRRGILIDALLDGFAALELDPARRLDYLAYHRDWLLRASLAAGEIPGESEREAAALLARKLGAPAGAVDALTELAGLRWREAAGSTPWETALRGLRAAVAPRPGERDRRPDPFTADPLFPALFKSLHGLANQLGCPRLEEASVHQLLGTAAARIAREEPITGRG